MPNTAALLGVAQQSASLAAKALAPSAAAAAGGATAGTLGTVLGAAVPILGIAAVAAPIISNLFSCGTVGTIGCTKRSDASAQIAIMKAARQIGFQVQQGQITPAAGLAQINQILQQAPQQFQRPTDWTGATPHVDVDCGSSYGVTGPVSQIDCNTTDSPQQVVEDIAAYIQTVTPPAGSAAAAQVASTDPITAVANAASVATGLPGWAVLAAAAVGVYFLVK